MQDRQIIFQNICMFVYITTYFNFASIWLLCECFCLFFVCVEQQFNQIEKQLISCNARLESVQKQHERLQKEHEETGEFKLKTEDVEAY